MAKKENKKLEESKEVVDQSTAQPETEKSEVDCLREEIEKLSLENSELKNQYFKAYADADNYKKRTQKELENAMKYRIQSFANKILPILDNLERALASVNEQDPLRVGVEMIYQQLLVALKDEGVIEIEAQNKPFDGNFHQSLMAEAVEGVEPGTVIEVLQKGYMLKDRILRASLVKISE